EQLKAAISVAQDGKKSADEHVKMTSELARDAKDKIRKMKRDADRAQDAARKAERAADKAGAAFASETRKMAALDIDKLEADELEKQQTAELDQENKVIDLVEAVRAAKALAAKRKHE